MTPEYLRARVLAEWRGLDQPPDKKDRCLPVADVLQKLLPRLGLGERLGEEEVREAWSGIVGEFLATHATPVGLSGGVLSVQVLQPSVRYELERNWKARILEKLQGRFGKKTVREIRFRIS
jgi:predicted nucleic acid-binding Zn ribbon protein